mgnify:CR=1 FL=1
MKEPSLKLVNDLSKLAESVLSLAQAKGEDKVILHMRGLRIEISPNGVKNSSELNIAPIWDTRWDEED